MCLCMQKSAFLISAVHKVSYDIVRFGRSSHGAIIIETLYSGTSVYRTRWDHENCPLNRGVLYSEVKKYTNVLASDRNKCPL